MTKINQLVVAALAGVATLTIAQAANAAEPNSFWTAVRHGAIVGTQKTPAVNGQKVITGAGHQGPTSTTGSRPFAFSGAATRGMGMGRGRR
jgi:hypothetical protein